MIATFLAGAGALHAADSSGTLTIWWRAHIGGDVNGLRLVTGLLIWVATATGARADQTGLYEYTVLRNGKPIGYSRVVADERPDGTVELTFDSEMAVKFGFLTVFRYDHQREELWQDGRLVRAASTTNDDGRQYSIEVKSEGGGYVRKVNNRVEALELGRQPLALWDPKSLNGHTSYFSVSEDKLLDVSFEFGGRGRVPWLDGGALVDHYKMTGDEERELWYDTAGVLVRAKFRRRNSDIEFVLNR